MIKFRSQNGDPQLMELQVLLSVLCDKLIEKGIMNKEELDIASQEISDTLKAIDQEKLEQMWQTPKVRPSRKLTKRR